jgi:single-stranded-DNA-specific exonuclease
MQLSARMQNRNKAWAIAPAHEQAAELAASLKVSPIFAQVLLNRGFKNPRDCSAFITPKLTDLIEPTQMPGITAAVERIKKAIRDKEKITIYGDYDVDGITATAILWQLLTILGAQVDYYIPHRVEEGYGLNTEAIEQIAKGGTKLLITVDCGITGIESATLAQQLGLDLIITDHHQPKARLPQAIAIVHPGLDGSYANPHSSGATVAFKLAWAIVNEFKIGAKADAPLRDFLLNATTLAAMGTVADVSDLRGENRVIVNYGLKALPKCQMIGVQSLLDAAGLSGKDIDSYHIGFCLAPMLNAAGRMGHARLAVELLTSDSQLRAMRISEYLKEQNRQRQQHEKHITKQACQMISHAGLDHPDRRSLVLSSDDWHIGVVGIVASRLIDKYYRPTILINTTNGSGQGSARSIPGFDILKAIEACSEHLLEFGGHTMAAGITIETKKIAAFAERFEQYAKENLLDADATAKLAIDALASVGQLKEDTIRQLEQLGPFGQGNPKPVFATKGVRLIAPPRKVGPKGEHLQLSIADSTGAARCIGFNMGALEKKILEEETFNIAYEPQMNSFNGTTSVQFVLSDIQFE